MISAGEYQAPQIRQKTFHAVVVSEGTRNVVARLRAQNLPAIQSSGTNPSVAVTALLENVGDTPVSVKFQEVASLTSGTRTAVTNDISLVPHGNRTVSFIPRKDYLELATVSGQGEVLVQMSSVIRYDQMSFGREDDLAPLKTWDVVGFTPWASL